MALQFSVRITILAFTFTSSVLGKASVPDFAFSWLDDRNKFQAGETATIKIIVLGNFDSKGNSSVGQSAFSPKLSVNGKTGNSSYVSGVFPDVGGDPRTWRILFTPIMAGVFNLLITEEVFEVLDSSLHYEVQPGDIYPSVCAASWMGLVNEFKAGSEAAVLLLAKDAFGNNISSRNKEPIPFNFTVSSTYTNGSVASDLNVKYTGWHEVGYVIIEFLVVKAGNFLLHLEGRNQTLNGSPLPFNVEPGPLDVSNCMARWKFDSYSWQLFSKMEIFVHQLDKYGNRVSELHAFDADITQKETNLSIPVPDMYFEEVQPGIQLLSFSITEPGNFILTISDMKHGGSIANTPYNYSVFTGYCDGSKSIVNGTGLNNSAAGKPAEFSVYLKDKYQYPSPVDVEILRVEIVRQNDSYRVDPHIDPVRAKIGSGLNGKLNHFAISPPEISPAPTSVPISNSTGDSKVQASAFNVVYTPEKSGIYEILVFCGNIILNGGHSFRKEVYPGEVNMSLSGVVQFSPKVPKQMENIVTVQLMDSYSNPVVSQQPRLKFKIVPVNCSGFSTWVFVDNKDGLYTGRYLAHEVGTYEMCVSFDDKQFSPCPFAVNVYGSEYFPKAFDDEISVWEDESISFNALENDFFAGDNASIVDFSKPRYGSILQHGQIFRYTPWKAFYGNDSFTYTMSDVNGNIATAAVKISVLSVPPQFVSFPKELKATEDVLSPKFGGFSGFEIKYSDPADNISITLSAQQGSVFLSPVPMQFWQPPGSRLFVKKGNGDAADLTLEGCVDVLNFALQSIQYVGKENFYGKDILRVSARNRNGKSYLEVPVFVEPINDAPYINISKFVLLKDTKNGSAVFGRESDKSEFFVGDPDLLNYPGGESQFKVTFSVEVDDGFLVATLPAELIDTTELKLQGSFMWQPLQTYISISKHFKVKAKGVRFHGTINDCNTIMQQLTYHGGEQGAVLTILLNDLGHYGCYPGCDEKISVPMYAEASVKLIRGKPVSAFLSHSFGSVIVIEFIVMLCLGVVLLFFTCKCAFLLANERRRSNEFSEPPSITALSKKAASSTGCCLGSNFRKR